MSEDDIPLPRYDFLKGAMLLVDKPKDWTSFDVVNKIRHKLKKRLNVKKIKVGHAGTLDPMATGLLIVCTGRATKSIQSYQDLRKAYTGTMQFGATTPSFDAETAEDAHFPIQHINAELIEKARLQFLGTIQQVPPMFSAIKVDGQPLYKRARKGETKQVDPREVHIFDFELTRVELPEIDFKVTCSKGTYIRALANDFGKALGSGAYLKALRRTAIGTYQVSDAWQLDDLVDYIKHDELTKSGADMLNVEDQSNPDR
ncbi:MAG: tRNA pseudouridine(55) synthase TruB [Saprospiraceae bacterium]|nr:tRNA pseudouridine(55) synthase TruB [Saprospiraceae bacterium]